MANRTVRGSQRPDCVAEEAARFEPVSPKTPANLQKQEKFRTRMPALPKIQDFNRLSSVLLLQGAGK